MLKQSDVDERNTKRMKQIVGKYGWPIRKIVGRDGMRAAWLLVQHADHAVTFQRKCLTLMEAHMADDQVAKADIAYLADRVAVNAGKPQTYGTQGHVVEGVWRPRPIRDREHVDQRRKSVGLKTLKEYIALMHT